MNIKLISSVDPRGIIGVNGDLLYDVTEDKQRFSKITRTTRKKSTNNAVLMGYNTWISIPEKYRPLPGRLNIICSKTHFDEVKKIEETHDNVFACNDAVGLVTELHKDFFGDSSWKVMGYNFEYIESLFIIGGGKIYESLIPYADEVILCHFFK